MTSWVADKIEHWPIDKLIPYSRNPRTHSDAQVAQIAASIREFGFTNPVLIDGNGNIIAGHGRVLAARKLGMQEVPCIRMEHLTETQRRAYIIADNKLALNAGWDDELLAVELKELSDVGFDLELTGFDFDELSALIDVDSDQVTDGLTDPDDVPETKPEAITKPGDIWLLGDHRLMCGDSTVAEHVENLMAGQKAVLMQTDPPYGVSHVATKNGIPDSGFSDMESRWEHIKNDDLQDEKLQEFLEAAFKHAASIALVENAAWYLWHAYLTQGFFAAAAAAADVLLHRQIIWVKPSFVLTRSGMYHWRHEPCFYGWRKGNPPPWYGDKNQSSVWEIGRDKGTEHPTQKPVALWLPPIYNHTKPGEIIYEPFSGSGSQIIAAEQTGRRCYAMELSPQYVDVAVRRWQQFTGKRAILEATGEPFPAE
jgi:DNA modification methylase